MTYVPPTFEESGSVGIGPLRNRHAGETAYIVGKGPSLANLRASDIGPGPVITINQAITHVDGLRLPNAIYAMQKDGCEVAPGEARPCNTCGPLGWIRSPLIDPSPEVNVVFTQYLSSWCLNDRPNRYVATDAELGYPDDPRVMSVLESIPFAKHLGATAIVMVAFENLIEPRNLGGTFELTAAAEAIMKSNLETVRPKVLAALDEFGAYSFVLPRSRRFRAA